MYREEARFVEDAETSERRLPPTHDISRPPEEPAEETRLEDPCGEITRNSEEIDKNGYCATSERKNVLFGTDRIIVEGFEEKDD